MSRYILFCMLLWLQLMVSVELTAAGRTDWKLSSGNAKQPSLASTQNKIDAELPVRLFEAAANFSGPMLVYLTGDGGWNTFSTSLCNSLSKRGIPVVGMDAQQYFWQRRSPEESASDLLKIIAKQEKVWRRQGLVLVGYSFGADIIPFLVNRFPATVQSRLLAILLISPSKTCDFEIHLSDMLSMGIAKGPYNVIGEIQLSNFKNYTALFGSDEDKTLQIAFDQVNVRVEQLQGSHHFDRDYESVANLICKVIPKGK
jgi:type IV secretory pathway VirJ component